MGTKKSVENRRAAGVLNPMHDKNPRHEPGGPRGGVTSAAKNKKAKVCYNSTERMYDVCICITIWFANLVRYTNQARTMLDTLEVRLLKLSDGDSFRETFGFLSMIHAMFRSPLYPRSTRPIPV